MKTTKDLPVKQQIRNAISLEKLPSIEGILKKYGIDIYDRETGELRDWPDIIKDIGDKWEEIPNK